MELGPFVNKNPPPHTVLHRSAIHKRWNHWHRRRRRDVAWLACVDKAGASANVCPKEVLARTRRGDRGVCRTKMPPRSGDRSPKPSSFCVGADISEFRQLHNERV